ncbi:MAG: hypothetical protein C5B49_00620 [Bdellovibrio sp.]|nr:MAG: hypothetical protein C5B49_00620 [Bdellovibrio sp.]
MKTSSLKTSQGGNSFVEILVASLIVTLVFYFLISAYVNDSKILSRLSDRKSQYFALANIRESIQSQPEIYQIVASEDEGDLLLTPEQLPWYGTKSALVSRDECMASSSCDTYQFRFGYVMYPHESRIARNLFTLKVRIYDVKEKASSDYQFLVAPR